MSVPIITRINRYVGPGVAGAGVCESGEHLCERPDLPGAGRTRVDVGRLHK